MKIFVKTQDKNIPIDAEPTMKVADVKRLIEEKTGIEPSWQ
jgi:hypothetical protein